MQERERLCESESCAVWGGCKIALLERSREK